MTTTPKQLDSQLIIDKLLAELGAPWLPVHEQALAAVKAGDAETLRLLSATNLDDSFCRACGYMASIPKMPPTIAILIAESARAIADAHKERATYRLNAVVSEMLS
ncbi:hypothetical protein [cf. Phormidesmis sp. LEGE 11477]|uniref:hypothetical protein n=1 Tax=cf. Phormidesmis sp. LEGE 11477 TaxID=1828680 RepID=UPI001882C3BF|nr:hypothetical protein [cf. Phormidesmis sp. LEGE 11477]MBE9062391.1 hypothetical protein [cf. Phormidesmis sp. LEGE 11477]